MRKYFVILIFIHFTLYGQVSTTGITVKQRTPVVPLFAGAEKNIISELSVENNLDKPAAFTEIGFDAARYSAKNIISSVKLFMVKGKKDSLIAEWDKKFIAGGRLKLNLSLKEKSNSFKLSVDIDKNSSLDSLMRFRIPYLKIKGKKIVLEKDFASFRTGYVVRKAGDYNSKSYRIPGLAVSLKGTLLAVYDIRKNGSRDLPADIDVGLSRSTDNGQTWQPMQTIMDMGDPQDQNGIGDPCILVDRNSGTIWVAALWSKGNRSWYGSKPGLSPDETGQFILVKSTDDGLTWSKPINITSMVKNPKWNLFFQGPGMGITLIDGTLVFPAQFKDSTAMPFSTIIYSKDKGATWHTGTGAKANTTEAQAVELENGLLMLNMRDNRGGSRSVAVTSDLGKTWQEHPSSRSVLIEPVCMASIIRVSNLIPGHRNSILAFSNPNSTKNRDSMTVKFSIDEGFSWNKFGIPHLLVDERDSYGYSCLAKLNDKQLGLLYEGVDTIYFVKVNIPKEVITPQLTDDGAGSGIIIKKNK